MTRIIRPARCEKYSPVRGCTKWVIRNTPFIEFKVTPNMPTIQVSNHKYIGSVVPMHVDYIGDDGQLVSKETNW